MRDCAFGRLQENDQLIARIACYRSNHVSLHAAKCLSDYLFYF